MKSIRAWFYAASTMALAGLAACGSDLDPPSRVTDLRVLAVRADQPYATPGAKVHVEALAFDPAGRTLSWGWGTCVDPTSFDVLDCIDAMDATSFTIATSRPSFDAVVPADALDRLPAEAKSRAAVGVVAVACPGALTLNADRPKIRSVGALPFTCKDAGGNVLPLESYVAGVKRIFVRATDANQNPVIDRITWDGADWPENEVKDAKACDTAGNKWDDCDASLRHKIAAIVPASSTEEGIDGFGVAFDEQLIAQYYATEGIFENGIRIVTDPETGWVARKAAAGGVVTMWFVVRDDRGGVVWTTRQVRVAAP